MRIYNNTGRYYEVDDDSVDERGLLKDGHKIRVPMYMTDHAINDNPRIPSWAMDKAACMLGRDEAAEAAWQQRQDGYALAELDLANRWRGGVQQGDSVQIGDRRMSVIGKEANGTVKVCDASTTDGETAKQQAYDSYDREISTAWMRTSDAEAGGSCTINGQTGKWRMKGGKLICCPDQNAHEWELAGPLSDAEAVKVKDAAHAQYESELTQAWRR